MKKYELRDIRQLLSGENRILGKTEQVYFTNVKPLKEVNGESLDWINPDHPNKQENLEKSPAQIIICDESVHIPEKLLSKKCFIISKDPKLTFLRIANHIFVPEPEYMIHPTAAIHPNARLAKDVFIGAFTYIGKSEIGPGTRIFGNCYIYDQVSIEENVTIHAGTVIGADGFGYVRNEKQQLEKFPHIGGVKIEDNVEIGANTCVDRGALGDTIIMQGAKIDNLVHIAHNVRIGKNSTVIANAMVAGSTAIGEASWIAPSSSILEQLQVGKNCTIGVGAVVTKNIPDGETWVGSPAKPLHSFIEMQKKLKQL